MTEENCLFCNSLAEEKQIPAHCDKPAHYCPCCGNFVYYSESKELTDDEIALYLYWQPLKTLLPRA